MIDNRTPEERAQDHEFMRKVTTYFTEILGVAKSQDEMGKQQVRPKISVPDADHAAKSTMESESPRLGF